MHPKQVLNPWAVAFLCAVCFVFVAADSVGPHVPSVFSRLVSTNKTADAWRGALSVPSAANLTAVSNAQVTTADNLVTVSNAQVTTADSLVTVSNAQVTTAANLVTASNTLQAALETKPTVALTNLALLNGTNNLTGTNIVARIGIGTNAPKSLLHILSAETNAVLQIVGATNQVGNLIEARNSGGTLKYAVNPSGEVGIGAAPTRPLYLLDNTQGGFRLERTSATARAWDFYVASDGSFNFYDGSGGGNRMSISTAGVVSYPTALNVGSGANVTAILSATATLDFDLSSAVYEDKTITVAGAQSGDCVSIGATASAVGTSVAYFAWVDSAGVVGVRAYRLGAAENPPSQTFRVTVIRH